MTDFAAIWQIIQVKSGVFVLNQSIFCGVKCGWTKHEIFNGFIGSIPDYWCETCERGASDQINFWPGVKLRWLPLSPQKFGRQAKLMHGVNFLR